MVKATAWPYAVFEDVKYNVNSIQYGQIQLQSYESPVGLIVDCGSLRERSDGTIVVNLAINTNADDVRTHVLATGHQTSIKAGVRILCKESKFRKFYDADNQGRVTAEIPLNKLRGIAQFDVLFLTNDEGMSNSQISLSLGTVIGIAPKPIILTLDEDWTGETIPVDWLDFEANRLPKEAFLHVELSGGSQTPKVWLNALFRNQIEAVLLRAGDSSPAALAGSAMRQFFWQQVWEKVVTWAVQEGSVEQDRWPASRIAKMWRERFAENGWELPNAENLDPHGLNEMSLRIQHCLLAAQNLSRVNGLLRFQPEARIGS